MTNINPNNDVGKISHNIKKEKKVNKKEKPVAETKEVEASSLNALSAYGRANINFKGNPALTFEQKLKSYEEKLKTILNSEEEISEILNSITEENLPIVQKLLEGDGHKLKELQEYFPKKNNLISLLPLDSSKRIPTNLSELLNSINKDNFKLSNRILFDDSFTQKELTREIIGKSNKSNSDLIETLMFNDKITDKEEALEIATRLDSDCIDFAKRLCSSESITEDEIKYLLKETNSKTEAILDELILGTERKVKNTEKTQISYNERDLSKYVNLIDHLYTGKDKNTGNDLIKNKETIKTIFEKHTNIDFSLVEKLYIGKDTNGNELFSKKNSIQGILRAVRLDTTDLCEKLCFDKNSIKKDLIKSILWSATAENKDLAEKLYFNEAFSDKESIPAILNCTTAENKILAEKLCLEEINNNITLNKYEITKILRDCAKSKEMSDFIEKLYFGKNGQDSFEDKTLIEEIINLLTDDKLKLAEKLYFNEKPPQKTTIKYILKEANTKEKIEIAETLCFGKNKDNKDLFTKKELISNILENITTSNIDETQNAIKALYNKEISSTDCYNIIMGKTTLSELNKQRSNNEYIQALNFLTENSVDTDEAINQAEEIKSYTSEQFLKYKKLLNKKVEHEIAKEIIESNDDKLLEKFLSLTESNYKNEAALGIAKYEGTENDRCATLIKNGINPKKAEEFLSYYKNVDELTFKKILSFFKKNNIDGYKISEKTLQNDAGTLLILSNKNARITKILNLKSGEEFYEKAEKSNNDYTKAYKKDSNRTILLLKKGEEIINQIEIINNRNGEPVEILNTKPSNEFSNAFETTLYTLNDYPEDMDVLKEIQNDTITGGKKLSYTTKNEDGSITYQDTYEYEGYSTRRNYNILRDENGKKVSETYKYNITDKNGNTIMNVDRSFTKNADGTTKTIINGNEYTTSFDDSNRIITIKDKNNNETQIDIGQKDQICSPENKKELWTLFKETPADILYLTKKLSSIHYAPNYTNGSMNYRGELVFGEYAGMIHELGHSIDLIKRVTTQEELIKIYNEEMEKFKKNYPSICEDILSYFGQNGGTSNTGLSEFFAETNLILRYYGNEAPYSSRAMMITKYFPQTIAKINELTNEALLNY